MRLSASGTSSLQSKESQTASRIPVEVETHLFSLLTWTFAEFNALISFLAQ